MGGCPRSVASRQTLGLWLLKCGLTCVKIAKIANFWYNFAKKWYTPLRNFFTNFGFGEGVPGPHPPAKFHRCGFKTCGLTASKVAKIVNFWYNFAKKGIPP